MLKSPHRAILAALVTTLASACPNPLNAPTPASGPAFVPGGPVNPAAPALSGTRLKVKRLGDGNDATPATLADVLAFEALTEGTQVKTLPRHWAFTSVQIRRAGLGTQQATATVGLGTASPAEEDALFEEDPNLLDEDQGVYTTDESSLSTQGLPGASLFSIAQVPAGADLRDKMPPVFNQGDRGTCEMASVASVMDHLYANRADAPIKQASVQFIYWNYHRNIVSKTDVRNLWKDPGTISTYLGMILRQEGNREISPRSPFVPANQGVVSAQDAPYASALYPPEPANPDLTAVARKHLGSLADRIAANAAIPAQGAQQTLLETRNVAALKQALAEGRPIVIGYPVFQADWNDRKAGDDIIPDLTADKVSQTGGHAVVLVGYRDDPAAPGGGYFIVRNSWGATWGDAGHCRISYKMTREYADDAYVLSPYAPFDARYSVLYPPTQPGGEPLSSVVMPADNGPAAPAPISIVAPKAT